MKYRVVKDTDLHRFVEFVNSLIEDGWKPLGGISACGSDGFGCSIYFLQSLVKVKG